jgi:hypothetical protein
MASIPPNNYGLNVLICYTRKMNKNNKKSDDFINIYIQDFEKAYHLMKDFYLSVDYEKDLPSRIFGLTPEIDSYNNPKEDMRQLMLSKIDWKYIQDKYLDLVKLLVEYHRRSLNRSIINHDGFDMKLLENQMNHRLFQNYTLENYKIRIVHFDYSAYKNKIKILYEFNSGSEDMKLESPQIPCLLYIEVLFKKKQDGYYANILEYRLFNYNYARHYLGFT